MNALSVLLTAAVWCPPGNSDLGSTLVWLHRAADSLLALAYYALAAALLYFALQRQDITLRWVCWLLGALLVTSGTTHWLDVWALWYTLDWLAVSVLLLTAGLAVVTAVTCWRLLPQALALPSLAPLLTANTRLREAQRMAHVGDWDYDLLTQTVTWSEELFRLFGLPPAPLAPTLKVQLQLYTPESQAQLDQAKQTAATTGTPYTLELQCLPAHGAASWLLARGEAVRETAGTVVRLVGTATDITETKQLAVAAEALSQLKDDFLSAVSHELRSPLTSMKLALHLLELSFGQCDPPLSTVWGDAFMAKVSRYLAILAAECERELRLVNELLELQRLESELVTPECQVIDLLDWLPDIVSAYQERASSRDQTLHLTAPDTLPPLVSDPTLLDGVLRELLTNACKYTPPKGTIAVAVAVTAAPTDSTLQLSVSNTGTAIPPAALPRLFEKFYRLPGADHWQQGGTGLGLALAQKQVARLGGTLSVTSDDNATVFCVELLLSPSPV